MRYSWYVFESGVRWTHAVQRFGPAALPSSADRLDVRGIDSIQSIVDAAANDPLAIVLWELPDHDRSIVMRAIVRLRMRQPMVIQFVSYSEHSAMPLRQRQAIDLMLREIGVSLTMTDLVDLPNYLPMVGRWWRSQRQTDRVSAVRQIWDGLPWGLS